ncbi:MAG: SRPBCC family protein [Bacteroidetes bacterium]|nr:MAG: SRPBCC family protein [Bacteroidota bacterium]
MPVLEKTLRIEAPVEKVYAFWRDFHRFAEFLPAVRSIDVLSETQSHWVVSAPFNTTVEFTAETTEHVPNRYLRWESLHGAGVDVVRSGGEITFYPEDDGAATRVALRFSYTLPSEAAQRVVDTLAALGYPGRDFDENLAIIKQRIEAAP